MRRLLPLLLLAAAPVAALDSYRMSVTVDPAAHRVAGRSTIVWTNTGTVPAARLYFHLYPNAFASTQTTLWKKSAWLDGQLAHGEDAFSRLTVSRLAVAGAAAPLELRFESADDGNPEDRTVAYAELPAPLPPGESVTLEMEWETKLHRYFLRGGFSGDSVFLTQWYPKLAAYEDGRWVAHQYHAHTEFYADFADYTLELDLPKGWDVAATGTVEAVKGNGDRARFTVTAENVHDLAVAASTAMTKVTETWTPRQGDPVTVTLFLAPEYLYKKGRILAFLRKSFAFYEDWVGPYLYDSFTAVFPTWRTAQGDGGMEYPQLAVCGLRHVGGGDGRGLEYTLAHEFGHQYFQGMVATDEVEEPWLDEGFTTYTSARLMEETWPEALASASVLGVPYPLGSFPMGRMDAINRNYYLDPGLEPMGLPGYARDSYRSYRVNAYNKPALALATMENYAGTAAMKEFLRDYFSKFAFAHPRSADVLDLVNAHFGSHWGGLFAALLKRPGTVDYRVVSVSPHAASVGYAGDLHLPVEVRVTFADGSKQNLTYEPGERVRRFAFPDKTVARVEVDPGRRLRLDADPRNNSAAVDPARYPAFHRFWMRFAHLMELFACWW